MIDQCILHNVLVYVIGWESLGPVLVTRYSYDLNMGAFVIHFRRPEITLDYTVLITPEALPNAIFPATDAGKVLFGQE